MKIKDVIEWLGRYGWSLEKGSKDSYVLNENNKKIILQVKIIHPPGKEIDARSVKKIEKALIEAGKESRGKKNKQKPA